jgi:protein TonB
MAHVEHNLSRSPGPSPAQWFGVLAAALVLTLLTTLLIPLCDLLAPRPRKLVEYRTIELSDWRPKPLPPSLPPPPKPAPPPPPPARAPRPVVPRLLAPAPQPSERLRLPAKLDFALGDIRSDLSLDFEADPSARMLPGVAVAAAPQPGAAPETGPPAAAAVAEDSVPLDRQPAILSQARPVYPYRARTRQIEGSVDLQFTVTAQGTADSVTVTDSQPPGVFDAAAVQAVRSWRFSPGIRDGQPLPVRMQIRIRFSLTD